MVCSKPRLNKITKLYSNITSSHLLNNINVKYFSIILIEENFYNYLNKKQKLLI